MVRSVNPKREKKELGYFCIFLHLVFGRVFLPQLQLCTNLSKNRKIKQHCQVTLMRAFTHFIPTIKPTNERNSFRYVFSRVSNVSETNFRHALVCHKSIKIKYRPRKDAELPGLEMVENLICAQLA